MENLHEIAAYTICGRLDNIPILNEERGRIPFIESILEGVWHFLNLKEYLPKENGLYATNVVYRPAFDAFFEYLEITELTIQIIQENSGLKSNVDGYFYPRETTWSDKKLDAIRVLINAISRIRIMRISIITARLNSLVCQASRTRLSI